MSPASEPRARPPRSRGGPALVLLLALAAAFAGCGGSSGSRKASGKDGEAKAKKDAGEEKYKEALFKMWDSRDPSDAVTLGDLAAAAGWKERAEAHWRRALEVQPDYLPAVEKLQYRQFRVSEATEELALEMPLPQELTDGNGKWVSASDHRALKDREKKFAEDVRREIARRKSDPYYAALQQTRRNIATLPGLEKHVFQEREEKPFLVFEHVGEKGEERRQADAVTARNLESKIRILKFLLGEMKARWMDPFGIELDPKLPLIVIALRDRTDFDHLSVDRGEGVNPNCLAYYNRLSGHIVLHNGTSEGEGIHGNAERAGTVFHEGVHQILEAFVNKGLGYDMKNAVPIPFWVHEGLAEYLGSVKIEGTTREGFDVYSLGVPSYQGLLLTFAALHPEVDAQAKALDVRQPYAFTLEELVGCVGPRDIQALVEKRLKASRGPGGNPGLASLLTGERVVAMVYSASYALFQFCHSHAAGRYAPCMDRYLKSAFRGAGALPAFLTAFGTADLGNLTREWGSWVEATVARLHEEQGKGR